MVVSIRRVAICLQTMPRHEMKDTTDVDLLGSFHLSGST